MRLGQGICVNCEAEIARPCTDCRQAYKLLENYTTVELIWSNGSRMTFPVCIKCSQGPIWSCDKKVLTELIWKKWQEQGGQFDRSIVLT